MSFSLMLGFWDCKNLSFYFDCCRKKEIGLLDVLYSVLPINNSIQGIKGDLENAYLMAMKELKLII